MDFEEATCALAEGDITTGSALIPRDQIIGRDQSLVVWAIREGRQCARAVDEYLMGSTTLPR
ncbi:MAG TPA: hypothetical protein VNI58_00380 [Mariprofundaceae bacterium]|nr:hypothetical protein [Mariprofundaceae bacterium]